MNTKRWIAIIIAAFLFIFSIGLNAVIGFFSSDLISTVSEETTIALNEKVIESGNITERIALLTVDGVIQDVGSGNIWSQVEYDHQLFLKQLDTILQDPTVQAIVLTVNSPGGGAIESAEIHKKLVQIKNERNIPIYVSMGSMAASGGYYIAAPADKIYAHRETITGSIGVIMSSYNFSQLAENFGIEFETIKSGQHKDMFSGTRASTEEEKAMMQEMINDSYEVFVDVVEEGRGMSEAEVKAVADGRILGGSQAVKAGLVDELGGLDDTIASLRSDYGLQNATLFEYKVNTGGIRSFLSMKLGSLFGPSVEQQMITKLMNSSNSPRLMYLYGEF
ncbi:signal peptide peptidase SppA [Ureibacillus acetophenoni]|uniref:Protease-4 n=1 Tax=Ureibacillus acetophenoni TaxID=614649 RepID=A0A285U435_9BACL|nr:signal peptide peptidase SppA [Ureibacillus acetophenoni]SOC36589.1 protease-4 [Ureibacillus acetophenoni]